MAKGNCGCFGGAGQLLKGLMLPYTEVLDQEWCCPPLGSPYNADCCVLLVVVGGGGGSGLWCCNRCWALLFAVIVFV
eukprot:15224941-Ditylum_brightwellii.AAC.1